MRMSSKLTPCRRLRVALPMLVSLLLFSSLSESLPNACGPPIPSPSPRRSTVHHAAHALETAPLRGRGGRIPAPGVAGGPAHHIEGAAERLRGGGLERAGVRAHPPLE